MPDDPGLSRELDLRDYLQVLRRRRGTIALTIVLFVGVALAFSLLQTRVYEATTQILIDLPGDPSSADSTAQATELLLMQAPAVRALVAQELGHPADVSVRPIESTNVFAITARSRSARGAALDADGYAVVYIDQHREQTTAEAVALRRQIGELDAELAALDATVASASPADRPSVLAQQESARTRIAAARSEDAALLTSLQPATNAQSAILVARASVPTSPVKPTPVRNVLIASVVGLVLGVGVAFVREHFDDAVRTKDDVERVSGGLPVVGMIPAVRRPRMAVKGW